MTDLYVATNGSDSNAGTKAAPFRTIAAAADEAKSGTTVHVAPGTYTGGFQTTTDGVTYVSTVKGEATIVPGAGNDRWEAWDNRGDNVVIDGFEVNGAPAKGGTPWLYGIYTTGSNSVVKNVTVHDIARSGAAMEAANSGGQGGAGIMGDGYYGGTNITVSGSKVYNIGPAGTDSSLVHGIYMATSGKVLNNLVHHAVGDGITSWHDATNLTVTGNTVYASHTGVMIGAGDQYHRSGSNDYSTVANNKIYDNDKGIEEYGSTGSHNVYRDNSVHDNDTNWLLKTGVRAAAVEDLTLADTAPVNPVSVNPAPVELAPVNPVPADLVPEHLLLVQQAAAPVADAAPLAPLAPVAVEVAPVVEVVPVHPEPVIGFEPLVANDWTPNPSMA